MPDNHGYGRGHPSPRTVARQELADPPKRIGRPPREFCSECEGHYLLVGRLSTRGKCADCSARAVSVNMRALVLGLSPHIDEVRERERERIKSRARDDKGRLLPTTAP